MNTSNRVGGFDGEEVGDHDADAEEGGDEREAEHHEGGPKLGLFRPGATAGTDGGARCVEGVDGLAFLGDGCEGNGCAGEAGEEAEVADSAFEFLKESNSVRCRRNKDASGHWDFARAYLPCLFRRVLVWLEMTGSFESHLHRSTGWVIQLGHSESALVLAGSRCNS